MNYKKLLFSAGVLVLALTNCGQENKPTAKADTADTLNTSAVVPDVNNSSPSFTPFTDTIHQLLIGGKHYRLILTHEIPSVEHNGDLTTTVRLVDNADGDTLYENTFDFNTVGQLRNPVPDHYWLSLYNWDNGSGYQGTLFNIRLTPGITLQPVLNFSELTNFKSNRTATELLCFDGIWDMVNINSDNPEAHFTAHKQAITVYQIREDTVLSYLPGGGLTKRKYFDEDENIEVTLQKLRKQEPAIAKEIKWEDYD
jgi:hypothetical protein